MTALRHALLLACVMTGGCVDYQIPEEKFTCRSQSECGSDQKCVRGPGCYCVCKAPNAAAEPNCNDPNCASVETAASGLSSGPLTSDVRP